MSRFHPLKISEVTQLTADAVALRFEVPEALQQTFAHAPGQYLTLRANVDGADIRRSYSIASLPGDAPQVGVKVVEGGAFSGFAQGLRVGDTVEVMPPDGRFVPRGEARLLLIAAGSGITPMVSIAAQALAQGAEVTLVYGNRRTETIMFRDTVGALKDRFLDRFRVLHILSREPQETAMFTGRITGAKITELIRARAIDQASEGVYVCGPGEMIDEVSAALQDAGTPGTRIHFERFAQAGSAPRAPVSKVAQVAAETGVAVELILDGTRREIRVEAGDDNVLAAAARQGLELPYSCKGGMCCTCRCKIAEGSAEMAVNYSLEAWETSAGFTLACQARPTSARLVLDFDAA